MKDGLCDKLTSMAFPYGYPHRNKEGWFGQGQNSFIHYDSEGDWVQDADTSTLRMSANDGDGADWLEARGYFGYLQDKHHNHGERRYRWQRTCKLVHSESEPASSCVVPRVPGIPLGDWHWTHNGSEDYDVKWDTTSEREYEAAKAAASLCDLEDSVNDTGFTSVAAVGAANSDSKRCDKVDWCQKAD